MYRTLRSIARDWLTNDAIQPDATSNLADVLYEVWVANLGLEPYPSVAVVTNEQETVIGVLCGSDCLAHRCFMISHMVIHPRCTPSFGDAIREKLVELAIDRSQSIGCHGWVACVPEPGTEVEWRQLDFYKHNDFTWRRMGYFSSQS